MFQDGPCLFALDATRGLGEQVGAHLDVPLAAHEERAFEDGEHKTRSLESVQSRDVYVVQSLYSDPSQSVNDKLCQLLFFIGALNDAGAARVTAVVPYLCYARKDRKTKPRDPVTTRYVARLFEGVEVEGILALDVHNLSAFQNAFRCQTTHLEAAPLIVEHIAAQVGPDEPVVVASPDVGGVKRAEAVRERLAHVLGREVGSAFLQKKRSQGEVTGGPLVGPVEDRAVFFVDDLVSTGSTLRRAVRASREQGAGRVAAIATHGVLLEGARDLVADPALEQMVITNTIPPFRLSDDLVDEKLTVLDTAPLFAEAIQRLHAGQSVVELR